MLKNDKAYAFLLSHRTKNKIYIKRVELPKNIVQFGSIAIFFVIGLTAITIGLTGLLKNVDIASATSNASMITQVSAEPAPPVTHIDYSRPQAGTDFSLGSGGPEEDNEADGENAELETQLKALRIRIDPANLPNMWAHLGKINNEFGFRRNPFGGRSYEFHPGMDIDGERGEQVIAPAGGMVIKAGWTGGYGNMVEIDHGNGLTTRYGHMSRLEAQVGQTIKRGELVGQIGSTGRSTGPHLHFEVRLNDKPINPRHFLPPEPTDLSKIEKK
jgi:murein DD-endopeptidase MepM/ murein hydrolase activator NlpD